MTTPQFTQSEITILRLLADGLNHREIGAKVFLSKRTVEGKVRVMRYMHDAKNTVHLVAMAIREGVV